MNPVTRFVKEVEGHLTGWRRLQTSAKIYKALSVKVDALEAKLGREPTDAEMEMLLVEFGTPAEVAARYSAMTSPEPAHDLVERYLASVERRLPEKQAKDIAAELREAIGSAIESREAETGHPATTDDIAAVLKKFGSPRIAGSRYANSAHLIGPDVYPYYWPAVRLAIGWTSAVIIIVHLLKALQSDRPVSVMFGAVGDILHTSLLAFAIVTLVFMLTDLTDWAKKLEARWDPRRLPQDNVSKPKTLFESLWSLGFDAIFIAWWAGVVMLPSTLPGRPGEGDISLHLSSAWAPLFWPILAVASVSALVHLADVFHPAWSRLRAVVAIAGYAAGIAIVAVLLQAPSLVDATFTGGAEVRAGQVEWFTGGPFRVSLMVMAAIWAISAGVNVLRLVKGGRAPASLALAF